MTDEGRSKEATSAVIERDSGLCRLCLDTIEPHAHHVVPISQGGADHPDNMILLCRVCHSIVHHGLKVSRWSIKHKADQLRKKYGMRAYYSWKWGEDARGPTPESIAFKAEMNVFTTEKARKMVDLIEKYGTADIQAIVVEEMAWANPGTGGVFA